jgi:ABC-type lipoprotein export system ATPase subunit
MVTHDPRWAGYADRTVNLFDGRVVDDDVLADQQLIHHVAETAVAEEPAAEAPSFEGEGGVGGE